MLEIVIQNLEKKIFFFCIDKLVKRAVVFLTYIKTIKLQKIMFLISIFALFQELHDKT